MTRQDHVTAELQLPRRAAQLPRWFGVSCGWSVGTTEAGKRYSEHRLVLQTLAYLPAAERTLLRLGCRWGGYRIPS